MLRLKTEKNKTAHLLNHKTKRTLYKKVGDFNADILSENNRNREIDPVLN
jgi:hypothetical protein